MTIIEFYKELSRLLTDTREDFISQNQAKKKLEDLLDRAKKSNLDVKISEEILDPVYLMRLDDEKSFTTDEEDFSYDEGSSYDPSY
jgi:hypothetical protein